MELDLENPLASADDDEQQRRRASVSALFAAELDHSIASTIDIAVRRDAVSLIVQVTRATCSLFHWKTIDNIDGPCSCSTGAVHLQRRGSVPDLPRRQLRRSFPLQAPDPGEDETNLDHRTRMMRSVP